MKKLATYKNGNTLTTIYDDGTKRTSRKMMISDMSSPNVMILPSASAVTTAAHFVITDVLLMVDMAD